MGVMVSNEYVYRFHKQCGTIHFIPGCCYSGNLTREHKNPDNYGESITYEEAEAMLKSRGIIGHKCERCEWERETK